MGRLVHLSEFPQKGYTLQERQLMRRSEAGQWLYDFTWTTASGGAARRTSARASWHGDS